MSLYDSRCMPWNDGSVVALGRFSDKFSARMRALEILVRHFRSPAASLSICSLKGWALRAEFLKQRWGLWRLWMWPLCHGHAPGSQVGISRVANKGRSSFIITNSPPSVWKLCGGWFHVECACHRFLLMLSESRSDSEVSPNRSSYAWGLRY